MTTTLQDLALEAARGDPSAAEFLLQMVGVLHFWDDLIDKDKALDDRQIHEAMFTALVALPRNAFYTRNFAALNTTLVNAIANWQAATRMEREGEDYEKSIAFIIRSSYVDLVTQVAFLTGGAGWAAQVADRVHLFAHKETYPGYLANLETETLVRDGGA